MQTFNPPAPEIITARETCRELLALLNEENASLTKQDIKVVEARIAQKKMLTMRLEQSLENIKKNATVWKENPASKRHLVLFAEEMKLFQELARKNALLLKAAHQLRAELIIAIRDALDEAQPKAQLYTSSGNMTQHDNATRLVARNI
jgi:hypothetical protein